MLRAATEDTAKLWQWGEEAKIFPTHSTLQTSRTAVLHEHLRGLSMLLSHLRPWKQREKAASEGVLTSTHPPKMKEKGNETYLQILIMKAGFMSINFLLFKRLTKEK